MEIYSIGFTKKSAGEFFGALKAAGIERLLDVRLNNTSQLAGFAKQSDLKYFLEEICGAAYEREPLLAPTQEILDLFKKELGNLHGGLSCVDPVAKGRVGHLSAKLRKKDRFVVQRSVRRALPPQIGARVFAATLERCSHSPSLDLSSGGKSAL
jgi:hypothetical protein